MEVYLLKSSIALTMFYGLYYLLIRKSTHYQLNRFAGLVCVLFSSAFVFLELSPSPSSKAYVGTIYHTMAQQVSQLPVKLTAPAINSINIVLLIYGLGVVFFASRFLIGLFTILRLYYTSPKTRRWGFKVIITDKAVPPFTFFNLLFIHEQILKEDTHEALIIHEQHHRDQWHSIDTILLELFTIVFWFNPFMWLFQRHIRASHEYMADQQVLSNGIDPLNYQQLLFEARTGVTLQLGSYLNNGITLKKRYANMLSPQNKRLQTYLKMLWLAPLMIVLLAFNSLAQQNKTKTLSKAEEKQLLEQLRRLELVIFEIKQNEKAAQTLNLPVKHPLYILKKKQQQYKISPSFVSKLTHSAIADISIMKGKKALDTYGKEGQNGVVIIRLKE